jgi:hypothetical protein
VRPECQHLKTPPVEYLRRFYYDTITHSHPALEYLIALVGPDRVCSAAISVSTCLTSGRWRWSPSTRA